LRRKKLLAVNFGGIGDEILFLPTLETIRRHYPQFHITLLVEPRSASVGEITDLVDGIITFDIKKRPLLVGDLLELANLLRSGGYDLVVSSGSSSMVSMLLFLSGIKVRVGYAASRIAPVLLTHPVKLNQQQYAVDMYHDLVRGLGLSDAADLPRAVVQPESVSRMRSKLRGTDMSRVLLHPGTSRLAVQKGIIKTWPVDHWIELIEKLRRQPRTQVILAGGPDDREIVGEILSKTQPDDYTFVSAVDWTRSFADLAALMSLCDLLVCVDSAPMHLGVALRKPLIALFGPTDEKKLLPGNPLFKALRGDREGPGLLPANSVLPPLDSGVQLPPDIVFRSVKDQLREASNRGNFQESRR
jgi:ADP-heptose:LPS heptosyltransferase